MKISLINLTDELCEFSHNNFLFEGIFQGNIEKILSKKEIDIELDIDQELIWGDDVFYYNEKINMPSDCNVFYGKIIQREGDFLFVEIFGGLVSLEAKNVPNNAHNIKLVCKKKNTHVFDSNL